ncbi:hypothetical protein CYMTET_47359 [Cymbomonas tetramitiformis]|uniref:Uncharacterized protein n=1 Tax=Cymbomonas tetramitiformis TaxID=36881 RepID=A0AAE0BUE9_9CHLO|nr:hypothetical protein CYMTET_47359 [Cymbomonas tetramitiformis]|eukprot:gene22387-27012_t
MAAALAYKREKAEAAAQKPMADVPVDISQISQKSGSSAKKQAADERMAAALKYAAENTKRKREENKGKRQEMIAYEEEAKRKNQEVEFISKDKDYKPTVTTWGMFPRPKNISKAYGGGRTIEPGAELETKEQRDERTARLRESLKSYKNTLGIDLDPEVQAKADAAWEQGQKFMDLGSLKKAIACFDQVVEIMPVRSTLAGEAMLQRAICLDSQGNSEAAKVEYKKLLQHPKAEVRKAADRMLYGFEAMKTLKSDTIDFQTQKNAYNEYLESFVDTWNSGYTGLSTFKDTPPAQLTATQIGLVIAMLATPLGILMALVWSK